jgi:hypothetical protein
MRQRFLAYDGKIQTQSGLYIFNPQHEAQEFKYDLKFARAYVYDGELMKCVTVFQQITKYRDLLFQHRVCLQQGGETMQMYRQQLRAYTSAYNEVVFRTEINAIDNAGLPSEGNTETSIGYYTDDSIKALRRKIYQENVAVELGYDHGDDKSMHGLNGYPLNRGLIINVNGTNQAPLIGNTSFISLGMTVSHPLLCHFLGGYSDPKTNISPMNTFEIMVTRAVHSNDQKGLGSLRNTEQTLSELNIIINLNKVGDPQ